MVCHFKMLSFDSGKNTNTKIKIHSQLKQLLLNETLGTAAFIDVGEVVTSPYNSLDNASVGRFKGVVEQRNYWTNTI